MGTRPECQRGPEGLGPLGGPWGLFCMRRKQWTVPSRAGRSPGFRARRGQRGGWGSRPAYCWERGGASSFPEAPQHLGSRSPISAGRALASEAAGAPVRVVRPVAPQSPPLPGPSPLSVRPAPKSTL